MGNESRLFLRVQSVPGSTKTRALVLDRSGRAHRLLSLFARYLTDRYAQSTVTVYTHALIRYFLWLADHRESWDAMPDAVRHQCHRYLNQMLGCQVRHHRRGFLAVMPTEKNASRVRGFLAAVRVFYGFVVELDLYRHSSPLTTLHETENESTSHDATGDFPRMPLASGVEAERSSPPSGRHTTAYFVLFDDKWIPRLIDDASFPQQILDAGARANWKLRDQIIARLTFESGARISEICGLTLGDWYARGLRCSATAFNKGSRGRRVKTLRFSEATAKLLRQYFDNQRRLLDRHNWGLQQYVRSIDEGNIQSLYSIPIFLTNRGTALTPAAFRDLAWRPACKAAQISAVVHQGRHWYVTAAIREIRETVPPGAEQEAHVEALISYMHWRNGRATLECYNHHFEQIRHEEIQSRLHQSLDASLRAAGKRKPQPLPTPGALPVHEELPDDPDWLLLTRLGKVVQ
nr:Tyrosine recombinase XerC [Paraburkholderia busanensis]